PPPPPPPPPTPPPLTPPPPIYTLRLTRRQRQMCIRDSVSTVSPTVGKELARNALYAITIASIGIIIYVSIRFEYKMAIAALSLIHIS
ncbi:hypothetical protein H8I07_18595, partial [Bacillus pumilus]|uniref:hypothetical protein n=1 Tax=Bacillus pumilus TaxID=1408 RepID=UPI001646ED0D